MALTDELTLTDKLRSVLAEEMPEASGENVERVLNRILNAIAPFEGAAADVLIRYAFADLAK